MEANREILKHCPHFFKIINFEFFEEDYISAKLIEIYKDFVFSIDLDDSKDIELVEKIDFVLDKYVNDFAFRKEIKSDVLNIRVNSGSGFLKKIVEKVIDAFENYESGYTRNIYFARWF